MVKRCLFSPSYLGTKKMEHKGNSWHENCFTCQHCKQPMGTCSFVNKEDSNYCLPCYEKQFALPCVHCKKVAILKSTLLFHLYL